MHAFYSVAARPGKETVAIWQAQALEAETVRKDDVSTAQMQLPMGMQNPVETALRTYTGALISEIGQELAYMAATTFTAIQRP